MRANELRIGNLIKYSETGMNFMVYEIANTGYRVKNEHEDTWIEEWQFDGIQLTVEWLIKFGFTKYMSDKEYWASVDNYIIRLSLNFEFYVNDAQVKIIKTVHELQNLIFALTGKELEFLK